MKIRKLLILSLTLFTAVGCTIMDGNAIVTGNTRSPISPAEVRLYRTVPENYEEIALVSASAGHDFQKSSSLMNAAIDRIKQEAEKSESPG